MTANFALDASFQDSLLKRFLRYVQIHTSSSEESDTFPSTDCQWNLLKLLENELKEMGLSNIGLDEHGYLFATLPSNVKDGRKVPTIGMLAHVDTYPGTNGKDVHPIVHDYQGGDIVLPKDTSIVISGEQKELKECIGHKVITADGTTLLGADDKSGIAIIMTVMEYLLAHKDIEHGDIRIGFTPDEEIGAGTKYFDVKRFGADAAYTFDGSLLGEIEDETFCADAATATVYGFDCHPGTAKGAMVSALRAACRLVDLLPKDHLPETTEKRESFLHPVAMGGAVDVANVKFIVRGFTDEDLAAREDDLKKIAKVVEGEFPGARVELEFRAQYRNMKQVLDKHPEVVAKAIQAVENSGLSPLKSSIRGGTDGAQLSFKGLPTPNIFAGGVNFHGKQEFVSLTWMAKAVETGINLAVLWAKA